MLFNSFPFILVFLPLAFLGWFLATRYLSRSWALRWMLLVSVIFYSWWSPYYTILLAASIGINFKLNLLIADSEGRKRKRLFITGILFNLAVIAVFKYADFASMSLAWAGLPNWGILHLALPLGISFYTFQQIAALADTYKGGEPERVPQNYALFITFFPHLIAGPIVHPQKILPQFRDEHRVPSAESLARGFSIFAIGLFKKVVIADHVAQWSSPVFDAPSLDAVAALDAWTAALSYTFQIYFDFSGYSDMAIGLALMFGFVLPANFDSPYKARSIVDFWRRWHITLSAMLRDYVYIPLGGNRLGEFRRHVNLMLTMLIGGLWHGAGWNFIVWGGLHGAGLVANHFWNQWHSGANPRQGAQRLSALVGWILTFGFVILTWVFFRSLDLGRSLKMIGIMFGSHGWSVPPSYASLLGKLSLNLSVQREWVVFQGVSQMVVLLMLLAAACGLPNLQQIFRRTPPLRSWLIWQPTPSWAIASSLIFLVSFLHLTRVSEFIYFQF